jgi:RNase adaptor protein for sRNA GlmZ degradation
VRRIPLDATLSTDVRRLPNPIAISAARGDQPSILAL